MTKKSTGQLNLIMGARNGAKTQREQNDYYATHPSATRAFLNTLKKDKVFLNQNIWEPACGEGHMAKVFTEYGYTVKAADLIDRGYGEVQDFLKCTTGQVNTDIFTNPPFKSTLEFAYKGLELLNDNGDKLGLFVKIQFLESMQRKALFKKYPPKYIYVYSERQHCAMNGDFEKLNAKTQAYIWIIWEKGYNGISVIRWI